MIIAALALGVVPAPLVPALLGAQHSRSAEPPQPENSREEQADVEGLKACAIGRRCAQVAPTRGWLVLRVPRPSRPRAQLTPLSPSYEDPRRALIPLRIDPPPEELA